MDRSEQFLTLFLQSQQDLRAFLGSVIRDGAAREDLFQDVAVILWRKFDQFDTTRSFTAWARGIAGKRVLQYYRDNQRAELPLSEAVITALADPEQEQDSTSEQIALQHCLDELPDRSRLLLQLRYETGLALKEMAARLEQSFDAVHKTLSRIRMALRDCVERRLALQEKGDAL